MTSTATRRADHIPARRRFDRAAEIVVGGFPGKPLLRERDAALDSVIQEAAEILGDALVRMFFPDPAIRQVAFPETESPHVTAG